MKKTLWVLMAVAMFGGVLFAAGTKEAAPAAADALKIAIVTSPSGVDDGSFNEDNYNGILAFIKNHPAATVTAVREPTGDSAAAVKAASDIVADYDVEVCTGFQFAGIGTLAQENPSTKFILVDSFPSDASGKEVALDNVYAMQFAEQESGFFAGMAAALETKTGKVAVVNGIAYPSNVNYQYGFMSGVKYVNITEGKNVVCVELASQAGTDVTGKNVGGNYIGSFADESTGKIVGQKLINEGCDIIFVAAGGSGNGVFTAAKESNGKAMIIGCDVDQWKDGANGDKNIILTSVLKNMAINVERQLENIAAGTFKGQNIVLKADTDSTGFVKTEGHHQMSADTVAKLDAAYVAVKAGKIVPAANFNGITPETFTVSK
ncbi:MAG: BMP family ABC transporter substrate-binding protein [Sphaerochaeta sp.]|jgi:basic membrane protein A|nr:BMP family ABC transporter substrate-binding protein [Sphaerochaeta sp.]MCH3920260.1 BMP family ABC transporter substrate-binding protein [Sphaerochaeta sp.]MCI2045080.1 BMP family ABC transporter substrate-binding protein [Sphaerochaeta sp.]MCI2076509.1 BMP family ABC transporter substrate-binding protein [Sphaerochaeta sp.]MCI2097088.1 BMP family ABC transporter substrate-binding protein [Sphaerochaeta sp.]